MAPPPPVAPHIEDVEEKARVLTEKLVDAAVVRKHSMFAAFSDLSREDLVQEAAASVLKALPDFDPAAASLSTFVSMVAARRLIDLWRRRSRQARREADYAQAMWGISQFAGPQDGPNPDDGGFDVRSPNNRPVPVDNRTPFDALMAGEPDPTQTLAEWLRSVYLKAKRQCDAARFRQGRRFHNVAQVVACAVLMERRGLSSRGAVEMFKGSKDLSEAVRFRHVPNHMWFWRCQEVATDFLGRKKGMN